MQLRSYQIGALDGDEKFPGAFPLWESGVQSVLIRLATGLGKSIVAAEAIKRQVGRSLFFVHLREILIGDGQTRDKIRSYTGKDVGVELAGMSGSMLYPEQIIVASTQTLNGKSRLEKFDPFEFSLIVLDEAHRGLTPSALKVINHFKQNSNCKFLYLTATPERHDKQKLGKIVDAVAYDYPLKDAVKDGWLVPIVHRVIEVPGLDLSTIRTMGSKLTQSQLDEAMERVAVAAAHRSLEAIFGLFPKELQDVEPERWKEYIGDRKPKRTLAFCSSVAHAEATANALNSLLEEPICAFISGGTPHDERRKIFRNFRTGRVPILANMGVTVEGYDDPFIEVLLMLRLTQSIGLFTQMIGRGGRTLPGTIDGLESVELRHEAIAKSLKPNILVCNFGGKHGKHKLCSSLDIYGESPAVIRRELEKRASEKEIDVEKEKEIIVEDMERRYKLRASQFDEYEIDAFTGKKKKKKLTTAEKKERKAKREAKPLTEEEKVRIRKMRRNPDAHTLENNRAWLRANQARRFKNLASYPQIFALEDRGWSRAETENMKRYEASRIMDEKLNVTQWRKQQQANVVQKAEEILTAPRFTDRMINETRETHQQNLEYGDGDAAF